MNKNHTMTHKVARGGTIAVPHGPERDKFPGSSMKESVQGRMLKGGTSDLSHSISGGSVAKPPKSGD